MSVPGADGIRARIDAVDDALVGLLAERAALVAELWAAKAAAGVGVRDPAREADVYARLRARAEAAGLDADAVERVFRAIVGVDLRR
ncbi:MAG: chorismate mutase [Myxococcota bacterium]